jgi:hypothetical protein
MMLFDDSKGVELKDAERDTEKEVEASRKQRPYLLRDEVSPAEVARYVRSRWDRLEKDAREKAVMHKVNWLRYNGHSTVQVHPRIPNQLYFPGGMGKRAPKLNKIKRTVHRYVAQITADEPIIEAVPAAHTDEARDSAEAATHALRGEFARMDLETELQRAANWAAIVKSGFWHFEWDPFEGEPEPAQKYFESENGEEVLRYVDRKGNPVDGPDEAHKISGGNICVEVGTPFNCRYTGHRYAHKATEVMWATMPCLRDVYATYPELKKYKVVDLLADTPQDGERWLEDMRAETFKGASENRLDETYDNVTGEELRDEDTVLDMPVFVLNYYLKRSRSYRKGCHVVLAGKAMVRRGILRYGCVPVAQFKCLDDPSEPLGEAIVDLLRDPQELLDFVNGQILRYLQMLRRRWFVPVNSLVKPSDLNSPTTSVIEYNPAAGEPKPENAPEVPNSLVTWTEKFEQNFNDESGIHDIMQGKHVPGVQSGRHAEALRSGDETLLGLTRSQLQKGLEAGGMIVLRMMKREWRKTRRIAYFGRGRAYVEKAFSRTDFGDTQNVRLKRGTMLMLTPAQKLETIFAYGEMGILRPEELRELAPLTDTAGLSLTEDRHYQRARRQNEKFLKGPDEELLKAREVYENAAERIAAGMMAVTMAEDMAQSSVDLAQIPQAMERLQKDLETAEEVWGNALEGHLPTHYAWEADIEVSKIHARVHSEALAHSKVAAMPDWWVQPFVEHTMREWEMGNPEQVQMKVQTEMAKMQVQMASQPQEGVAPEQAPA